MAAGLGGRIRRLEAAAGGGAGECPRCSGVIGVFVAGELRRASRRAAPMSEGEWREVGGVDGRCPACGRAPVRLNVVEEEG